MVKSFLHIELSSAAAPLGIWKGWGGGQLENFSYKLYIFQISKAVGTNFSKKCGYQSTHGTHANGAAKADSFNDSFDEKNFTAAQIATFSLGKSIILKDIYVIPTLLLFSF